MPRLIGILILAVLAVHPTSAWARGGGHSSGGHSGGSSHSSGSHSYSSGSQSRSSGSHSSSHGSSSSGTKSHSSGSGTHSSGHGSSSGSTAHSSSHSSGHSSGGKVHVHGYTKKDGTYVAPYTRSAPTKGSNDSAKSSTVPHESSKATPGVARDSHGKIKRSESAKHDFEKTHACPATGKTSGACPGYVVDHIKPLKRGGADEPSNMQWQTIQEGKAKDKWE